MTTIVGIDPSLTSSGIARIRLNDDDQWTARTWSCPTTGKRGDTLDDRNDRMTYIVSQLAPMWQSADLAVIEAPAYNQPGGSTWDRAGLWWRIVHRLAGAEVPVAMVGPKTRAKWATGNGGSGKRPVIAAAKLAWPGADVSNSDKADALVLASIGAQALDLPVPFEITDFRAQIAADVKLPERVVA